MTDTNNLDHITSYNEFVFTIEYGKTEEKTNE